jgi:hypothetical protein
MESYRSRLYGSQALHSIRAWEQVMRLFSIRYSFRDAFKIAMFPPSPQRAWVCDLPSYIIP